MDTLLLILCLLTGTCLILLIILLVRCPNTWRLSKNLAALEQSKTAENAVLRGEINTSIKNLSQVSLTAISSIGSSTAAQLEEMRASLDRQLAILRGENQKSLERMQAAVDTRLSENTQGRPGYLVSFCQHTAGTGFSEHGGDASHRWQYHRSAQPPCRREKPWNLG